MRSIKTCRACACTIEPWEPFLYGYKCLLFHAACFFGLGSYGWAGK